MAFNLENFAGAGVVAVSSLAALTIAWTYTIIVPTARHTSADSVANLILQLATYKLPTTLRLYTFPATDKIGSNQH